jgi:hypothetical protein
MTTYQQSTNTLPKLFSDLYSKLLPTSAAYAWYTKYHMGKVILFMVISYIKSHKNYF